MKKNLFTLCGFLLLPIALPGATNVIFISFHPGENTPSAAAAAAGATQAPDALYTQLLTANGYNVTRVLTSADNVGQDPAMLNAADLIIISRSVDSAHYDSQGETAFWNSTITAPVMVLGGYVLRNNRLGYTTGTTIPDVTSNPVRLTVNNPSHPIFAGISLDAGNTMVNDYATLQSFNGTPQRGISVNSNPLAGGGTVLATVGTAGDPAFGGMIIGEWQPGSVMADVAPSDTLGGHRLVFLTGSREHNGAPTTQIAGLYDLSPDGAQMFLNAVSYMAVPEPSTWAFIGLGLSAFVLLRRRAK